MPSNSNIEPDKEGPDVDVDVLDSTEDTENMDVEEEWNTMMGL